MTESDRVTEPRMRQRTGVPPLGPMFLMVAMMPSLFIFVTGVFTLGIGAALAALFVTVTVAAYPNRLHRRLPECLFVFAVIAILSCLHLAISGLLHPVSFGRAFASFVPLLAVIVGGSALGSAIENASDRRIDRGVGVVIWAMCLVVVMERLGLSPHSGLFLKSYFPFTEPSLFVLAFMPFYTYACISAVDRQRLFMLALGLILIVVLQNLTMAVGWIVVAFICMRGIILPLLLSIALAGILVAIDLSYFVERLDFSGDSQNLSTLVWLQGWQLAQEALNATYAWGAGFQQLGINGTNTAISRLIYLLTGSDLNILDGGFVAAKLVSEFGVIGIAIVVALLTLIGKSVLTLRAAARNLGALSKAALLTHAIFVGYFLELLVRGAGYFSGSMVLLIAALQLRTRMIAGRREKRSPLLADA